MKYLYLDNYRGFQETYIPIVDVNFLVGENSTGKSSILALINLLGSPEFWITQEFNNSEVELGAFRDILSKSLSGQEHFRIGVIEFADKAGFPTEKQNTFLMDFVNQKGVPRLREYSFIDQDQEIRIVFGRKVIKYKVRQLSQSQDIHSTLLGTFRQWVSSPANKENGFRILHIDIQHERLRKNLLVVKSIIQDILSRSSDKKMESDNILSLDIPTFAQQLAWIAPVRSEPQRIYSGLTTSFTPTGEHIPRLIKTLLSREKISQKFSEYIANFGNASGLFERVYIRSFGKSMTSPFELGVILAGERLRISDVGYGVSQSLPIIVEIFARRNDQWFALQQPEVHLHPRAQAALGDLFMELAAKEGKRFFIETHSDYLIDRFRVHMRSHQAEEVVQSQVLFFEHHNGGNRVHSIPILPDGNYSEKQPDSFRAFFINEEITILGL